MNFDPSFFDGERQDWYVDLFKMYAKARDLEIEFSGLKQSTLSMDSNEPIHDTDSIERKVDLDIPRRYRYTSNTILPVMQLAYLGSASYFAAENLENSKILQATLPFYMSVVVAGSFLLREGYSRTANGLLKLLYSDSTKG